LGSGPSKEEIDRCKNEVHRAVSSAVKVLFDSESNGGDFYAHILLSMDRLFDVPGIGTAAVSITNKLNLFINSYFFVQGLADERKDESGKVVVAKLDLSKDSDRRLLSERRAAVLQHEILHTIFHHLSRGRDFGNHQLANIAMDLVVNCNLNINTLGKLMLHPTHYDLPVDKTVDWYYKNFPIDDHPICQSPKEHDQQYQQGQGQGQQPQGKKGKKDKKKGDSPGDGEDGDKDQQGKGKGKGKGEQGQGNEQGEEEGQGEAEGEGDHDHSHEHSVDGNGKCKVCGGLRPLDNHDIWDDEDDQHMSDAMKEMRKSLINDAINRAAEATKNIGKLPNSIQEMIALAKKKAQIPWNRIARQFVSRIANGDMKTTKKKRSKRFGTFPGLKIKPKIKLGVGPDVSGSISPKEYEIFLNEIFAICKATGCDVEVVEWDAGVQGIYKIKSGKKHEVTRTGCGGTDPSEAIKYFNDRRMKFDGVIFMTDGHIPTPSIRPRVACMWVVTADGNDQVLKDFKQRVIRLPKADSDAA
jgi:predicted metal-dependent peptidase